MSPAPDLPPGGEEPAPGPRPRFLRRRRAEALAAIIPLAAFISLMPPFVRIFAHDGRIFGAPVALVFLLALWTGLVIATRMLSRRLMRRDREP
ncbi:hypothetical protein P2H44_00340 [Albimonas sp. CAU 1670]|uniref:hypothetical protein n=1 Tax=Albimonas sp. CAU 1670 TaxID=3032599 RepID=UPI0023DA9268|nr:hypothetical protein [Albimonas sp. CAU 1670]MDF2230991.1 hypothetical protein [Albimonas sp. CAU 1670]